MREPRGWGFAMWLGQAAIQTGTFQRSQRAELGMHPPRQGLAAQCPPRCAAVMTDIINKLGVHER